MTQLSHYFGEATYAGGSGKAASQPQHSIGFAVLEQLPAPQPLSESLPHLAAMLSCALPNQSPAHAGFSKPNN